ncbi:MAG TPA: hypothetical protein VFX16_23450, partial [Pseudonocardiaceae bacterium]|nr:hypothetical protein [Pseudonocardiaceae bacterium]
GPVFYDPRGRRRRWTLALGVLVAMVGIGILTCVGLVLGGRSTGYEYPADRAGVTMTTLGVSP